MKWFKFLCMAVLVLSACTKKAQDNTPEGALDAYVTAAFSAKTAEDKKTLVNLSTGDALAYISQMTDEEFKRVFLDSGLKLQTFKAKDITTDTNGDVSLVYDLAFKAGKPMVDTVHTAKKVAYLTNKDGGVWKIKATKNVKTFIERKDDLIITPDTTSKEDASADKK
jgi:hypothetical protein